MSQLGKARKEKGKVKEEKGEFMATAMFKDFVLILLFSSPEACSWKEASSERAR
jgi:hypothetical protein